MTAYLANENGTMDPFINVFGVEKNEKMDTAGFEEFSYSGSNVRGVHLHDENECGYQQTYLQRMVSVHRL